MFSLISLTLIDADEPQLTLARPAMKS